MIGKVKDLIGISSIKTAQIEGLKKMSVNWLDFYFLCYNQPQFLGL